MKWVCRSCLTAFSSEPILFDHTSRCINQQPTNATFSWKDHSKFEDYHVKMPLPIRVYAVFECMIQPTNNRNVFYKQSPIAVGFYLISPFGIYSYSYFGKRCVTWFVSEILFLGKFTRNYFKTNIPLKLTPEEVQFQ